MAIRYFERIVVGLALAPVDRDLLRYAKFISDLGEGQTRITFIHVMAGEKPGPLAVAPPSEEAREALDASVSEVFGSGPHDIRVLNDSLVDALLTEAADGGADLILVGHRRNSRGRRSLSRRLAIKAPCSVWMVPEGSSPQISRIVAAVDMSQPSALALSTATLVAQRARLAQCTILHVVPPTMIGYEREERAVVTRALDQFMAPLDTHGVETVVSIEEAASVSRALKGLLERGEHDLVVVGTRGRSRSAAVLLGSESEEVIQQSPVPVLVTKELGERIGVLKALLARDFKFQYTPQYN